MTIVDENGSVIQNPDLTAGYLVDDAWIDHPQVDEVGRYEYEQLEGGGRLQKYVVVTPYEPARREVTRQRYVLYTAEELAAAQKADYAARLDALEAETKEQRGALEAIAAGAASL